jgi:hypothetical protein
LLAGRAKVLASIPSRPYLGSQIISGGTMQTEIPRHSVRVVYTEPEFQRRTPGAPAEYRFDYQDIPATSAEEAIATALREFWYMASMSRVGWRRCIQSVSVLDRSRPLNGRRTSEAHDHS